MATMLNSASLPITMEDKLRAIRRRLVLLSVTRACAYAAAALLVVMIVVMGLDWWLTLFSTVVRVGLTAASLTLSLAVLLATGMRPLRDALQFARAAANADGEVPQLEERWTTVTSFATSPHQPTSATARAMLQQVTSEAIALGRLVRPAQIAKPAALKPALYALSGSGLLLVAFLATNWSQTSILLRRFWSPLQNITATQLASVTGDRAVPRGERLDLVIQQTGVQRSRAKLEVEDRDGILDVYELSSSPEKPGAFACALPVDNSFRYRVSAGDGQTPWHQVTAIDYPELAEVQLIVTPPEYVNRPPYQKKVIPSRVKVVQGSRLELLMKPVAVLQRFELQLIDHLRGPDGQDQSSQRIVVLDPQPDGWYRYETQLVDELSLSPMLLNAHGLKNEDKRVCRFQVVADKAPVARIVSPTDEMAVAVDEVIDIKYEVHDDFGIATAELVVYDESTKDENGQPKILAVKEIELGEQKLAPHIMGQTQLDLKELNLKEGTNISYAIRVTDNRDLQIDPEAMAARRTTAQADKGTAADATNRQGDRRNDQTIADATDAQAKSRREESSLKDGKRTDAPKNKHGADRGEALSAQMLADAAEEEAPKHPQNTDSESNDSPVADATKPENNQTGDEPKDAAGASQPKVAKTDGTPERNKAVPTNGELSTKTGDMTESSKQTAVAKGKSNEKTGDQPQGSADDSQSVTASDSDNTNEKENRNNGKTASAKNDKTPADAKTAAAESGDDPGAKPKGSATSPKSRQVAAVDPTTGDPRMPAEPEKEGPTTRGKHDRPSDTPQSSNDDEKMTTEAQRDSSNSDQNHSGNAQSGNRSQQKRESSEAGVPRDRRLAMNAQQGSSAQNSETGKRRLRITERLLAMADAGGARAENLQIRDRIVHLDRLLKVVEEVLIRVIDRNIPDADRAEQFRRLDKQIGEIEAAIAELRKETQEKQFAFVGLQMVHIGTTHVTPARDRVFAAIREPLGTDNPKVALHHITRAREMLEALLKRYDRVAREEALAEAIDESVKMYEVYVEKMQTLMREARQNMNPLQRKMAVIEVDQDYLDRYAEVEKLRREMMTEFGRMLGDDPRLLARYLDLLRRRNKSLRDQLTELAQRQDEVSTELSSWLQVGEAQRDELWTIVADLRRQAATPLAKEADGLLERTQQSMPLVLKDDEGTARLVLEQAEKVARAAREITFDVRKALESGQSKETPQLTAKAEKLAQLFGDLDAALDQLNFENEGSEEVGDYVSRRLIESRTVADQADAWAEVARFLESKSYNGLAEIDQRTVAIATELLRIEMLGMETDLEAQFQQVAETSLPGEIADMLRDLHRVMEGITFTQHAASFALTQNRLEDAEIQEQKTLDGFDRAQKLFDLIRKAVVAALDEFKVNNPNIADLQDPTLDRFLAQLEREPNIEAQLGIPNRPRNLRVLAESMEFQQNGGDLLGDASETARRRAQQAMQMTQNGGQQKPVQEKPQKPDGELTDDERKEREQEKQRQQMLEKTLASVREKLDDPQTPPEQKAKLEQMAQNMQRMLEQNSSEHSASDEWERIVESDQAKEALRALASGQRLPDSQWNKLLSTLDDGLWQVRGRKPPEDYRKAIEQYQDRLRRLIGTPGSGSE